MLVLAVGLLLLLGLAFSVFSVGKSLKDRMNLLIVVVSWLLFVVVRRAVVLSNTALAESWSPFRSG